MTMNYPHQQPHLKFSKPDRSHGSGAGIRFPFKFSWLQTKQRPGERGGVRKREQVRMAEWVKWNQTPTHIAPFRMPTAEVYGISRLCRLLGSLHSRVRAACGGRRATAHTPNALQRVECVERNIVGNADEGPKRTADAVSLKVHDPTGGREGDERGWQGALSGDAVQACLCSMPTGHRLDPTYPPRSSTSHHSLTRTKLINKQHNTTPAHRMLLVNPPE
jgi:hypothetical protein